MLKKTIKYTNFFGEEKEEDFFFHLSKAELVEMELSHKGGLSQALTEIIASEDGKAIVAEFKNIILTSYGKRSEDGRRFIKNQELRDEFESTEAYSTLFIELVTNTDAAIEFINGIVPTDLSEEVAGLKKDEPVLKAVDAPEPEIISQEQLLEMSREELHAVTQRISKGEAKLAE